MKAFTLPQRLGNFTGLQVIAVVTVCVFVTTIVLITALYRHTPLPPGSSLFASPHSTHAKENYLLRAQIEAVQHEISENRMLLGELVSSPFEPELIDGVDWSQEAADQLDQQHDLLDKKEDDEEDERFHANSNSNTHQRPNDDENERRLKKRRDGAALLPVPLPTPAPASFSADARVVPSFAAEIMAQYVTRHASIVSGHGGGGGGFIVCRPSAQMNNRVRVLVTGIVLGMLTGRAVLADFDSGYYAQLSDLFDIPIQIDLKRANVQAPQPTHFFAVQDVDTLLCADYNVQYGSGGTLMIDTPPSLLPYFIRNPHYRDKLLAWFGDEEHIYSVVARYFLRPSATVQRMMDAFENEHDFAHAATVIGVHLRWGPDHRPNPVPQSEWDDMLACVKAVSPVMVKSSPSSSPPPVIVFVAADTGESRAKAALTLSSFTHVKTVNGEQLPVKVIFFGGEWKRSNNVEGVQAALAELLILSHSHTLVLTPHSSYGEQAMALNGRPAYYIRSDVPHAATITYTLKYMVPIAGNNCLRTHTSQPSVEGFSDTIEHAKCYHPDMYSINY